ncbi:MAG TPA: S53 family serine peptidase [Candidatus Baltobacteraceae bacterium]
MKRLAAAALAVGIITTSCSGHGSSALPTIPGSSGGPSTMGVHTTRAAASVVDVPLGFATTATGAVTGLVGVTDNGALPATQTLTVHVALQLHNADQLKQSVAAGQITPRSTFMSTYAPTAADVQQVTNYLQSQGFTNISVQPNHILIDATGTVATIEKAFSTQMESYSDSSGLPIYANTKPAYIPQALAGTAIAILGLNDVQMQKPSPKSGGKAKNTPTPAPTSTPSPTPAPTATPTPAPTPVPTADACTEGVNAEGLCPRFFDPASIELAYDAANAPTGANTSVAIFTEGDPAQAISDFRWNEQVYNLRQVPVNVVQVEPMTTDTSGNGEWVLDMTAVQGLATDVKRIDLYNFASLSDSDIVTAYNKWVIDNTDPIGNSSFGGCEIFPYQDGAMLAADEVLVEAASQGQTMFVSTGDNGGYCNNFVDTNGAPGGAPMVEWPAASPYVAGVGGTDLFSNADGTYLGETAWEAGGGGLSQFEYGPYWETSAQPVNSVGAVTMRGLPDIAMDASIETGYLVYSSAAAANGSCTPCIEAGTSLASPLAAGAYARMQSAHGNSLGFAPIRFYKIYANNPNSSELSAGPPPTSLVGGFHDILSGSNGAYTALTRYDYTTGLGSFDVVKTNAVIGQ